MYDRIERVMTLPMIAGVLVALALITGLDVIGSGRSPDQEARTRQVALEWVAENEILLNKSLKMMLVGVGALSSNLTKEDFKLLGEIHPKTPDVRIASFQLQKGPVKGNLILEVDIRTNPAAGVVESVARASLANVITREGGLPEPEETIYSARGFVQGRIRYYITVFSSVIWHIVIAGVFYGLMGFIGLGPKASVGFCILVAATVVAYFSGMDTPWLAGSAGLGAILLAWGGSEFIRHKRHIEVLRMISG